MKTSTKEKWHLAHEGVTYTLELEIDHRWLLRQLGERAVQSKGKRSQALAGAVIVRVIDQFSKAKL